MSAYHACVTWQNQPPHAEGQPEAVCKHPPLDNDTTSRDTPTTIEEGRNKERVPLPQQSTRSKTMIETQGLPWKNDNCMSFPGERSYWPTTETPPRSHLQVRAQSLNRRIVNPDSLQRDARPRVRWSFPRANPSRSYRDNLRSLSAPSEVTTTQEERRESSQGDSYHCWMFDHRGVQSEDDAKEPDTKERTPEADWARRPSSRSDRVQATWTASRLMAKTAILVAAPVCNLIVLNYAHAHGLLLLPGSERISGDGWRKYQVSTVHSVLRETLSDASQASFSSHISWLDCPNPLLLLTASMAGGSLMLSYHQLNIADDFQTRILIVFVCVSMIFGLCAGRTVLATVLSILPWAIYVGLGFSDLLHAGRTHRMVRKADNDGGRRADGVCEKV
jgi:hypothetical protein